VILLYWRGRGLLAVASLFPLLASCGGLIDGKPNLLFALVAACSLLLAGCVCIYYGTKWNRGATRHSFYFIPLQVWGWAYLVSLGFIAAFAFAAGIIRLLWPIPNPDLINPASLIVAGFIASVLVVGIGVALIRATKPLPLSDEFTAFEVYQRKNSGC
jgi:predicted Co/Zn/Cd cation transporter (cation efflux family)